MAETIVSIGFSEKQVQNIGSEWDFLLNAFDSFVCHIKIIINIVGHRCLGPTKLNQKIK